MLIPFVVSPELAQGSIMSRINLCSLPSQAPTWKPVWLKHFPSAPRDMTSPG